MVKSNKGKEVNMEALMIQNQNAVALGNARMNARGDQLGRNGKVEKTREELAAEYNTKPTNAAVNASLTTDVLAKVKAVDSKKSTKSAKDEPSVDA